MNVIYYYYFLFYSKVFKEDEPHLTARLVLSFCQSLFINGLIADTIALHFFCYEISKWIMISVLACILLFNYFYYSKSGRDKIIVKEKPVFFGSQRVSILISIIFFVVTISWMFWGPFYGKYVLDNCN